MARVVFFFPLHSSILSILFSSLDFCLECHVLCTLLLLFSSGPFFSPWLLPSMIASHPILPTSITWAANIWAKVFVYFNESYPYYLIFNIFLSLSLSFTHTHLSFSRG
ncbi:hypothetical protein BS50DRAFT_217268 [Corynespora cassiicola Philippines]|uniref:Uncharacterized protein n=1 Tax=Corynespora cassiicola Philippines TaxID=1448308 RepID=A0A2T2N3K9_CORCC|nr:hypothetical protein BS50DRAFT_217268 [Corynespora cassiicola Philippines]